MIVEDDWGLISWVQIYRGADKSLARPGRKQATATEDFEFHISIYNHNWRNISTLYIYNKTSIKRNILTIKQNTSGSRSGLGLTSTPVLLLATQPLPCCVGSVCLLLVSVELLPITSRFTSNDEWCTGSTNVPKKFRSHLQILGVRKVTWCKFQFWRTINYKTDSMEHSPSWEANRSSTSPEILRILEPGPCWYPERVWQLSGFSAWCVWADTHFYIKRKLR